MGASLLALAKSIYYAPTTLQNDNPSDVKKKKKRMWLGTDQALYNHEKSANFFLLSNSVQLIVDRQH